MSAIWRPLSVCAAYWCAAMFAPAAGLAQYGATNGEWRSYGGDLGSTKYSPLDQIDASNFNDLRIAWSWQSVDGSLDLDALREQIPEISIRGLQATPLMVAGVLYLSTALHQAAAVDAGTGKTIWVHDPKAYLRGLPTHGYRSRGVAYWTDGQEARIFWGTSDGYLVGVDAQTGQPVLGFGDNGRVDLMEGIPRATRGATDQRGRNLLGAASPPIVARDVIVTPTIITDYATRREAPPGWLKGIDARTGDMKWMFRTVPQEGDLGVDSWLDDSWRYSGNTNVWALLSADAELGLVYLPTGTPTSDYYGGHRLGDNLFAESLVALDCATGRRVWHFQMIHHGLWDYDNPAAPILVDITVDGRPIKAVVQVTKQGFTYVFDRVTGEPVWPIVELAVPPSLVPGERASPTQPFPTWPLPFERQGIQVNDLIDFTPELRAEAIEILGGYVFGPMFTPPSVRSDDPDETQGTIQLPGWVGGADWNGAAVDPETQILYVPSVTAPIVVALVAPDPDASDFNYVRGAPRSVQGPRGLPLVKPPWGRITAIDLNTGDHLWMVPNGEGIRDHEALQGLDLPKLGTPGRPAPLLTKTLLFIGEGSPSMLAMPRFAGGKMFRAYDKDTGEVLWEMELPAGTAGAPMTYMADGKQYIVVGIGEANRPAEFIALSLP